MAYESLKQFEEDLNAELKTGNLKVHVVMVPMTREQLYPALAGGKVDMVAAMVTVTPEREKLVAFSTPTRTDVNQVVVTGPGAPPIASRRRSLRPGSVRPQGQHLRREHRRPEQAAAGARQAAGRDRRGAGCARRRRHPRDGQCRASRRSPSSTITSPNFWSKVFTDLKVHSDVAVRTGGVLAVAFRKDNPKLRDDGQRLAQASTARATASATWSNAATSRTSSTRRTPASEAERKKLAGGDRAVQEIRRRNTTSTTC